MKTSQWILKANQLTRFYMIGTWNLSMLKVTKKYVEGNNDKVLRLAKGANKEATKRIATFE